MPVAQVIQAEHIEGFRLQPGLHDGEAVLDLVDTFVPQELVDFCRNVRSLALASAFLLHGRIVLFFGAVATFFNANSGATASR
jgi:hypothetical protein